MAITLVVNPGSTSRKYAFYRDSVCFAHVAIEVGDTSVESCVTEVNGVSTCENWSTDNVEVALKKTVDWAIGRGLLADYKSITMIAVRVVAPGDFFANHRPIDSVFKEELLKVAYLVPVHIPIVLTELSAISELFPQTPCFAISDSAFHNTMWPQVAQQSLGSDHIKNYGYHGLSFASISHRLEETFSEVPKRTVVLHIGGGVSIAALYDGKAVASSMGFTPASGVVMGSRGGDVGADAIIAYMHEHDLTPTDALLHLYRNSGFKALTGISDLRLLLERTAMHDEKSHLALAGFVQQVATEVASRALLMGGLDAIVLTATACIRNSELRARLMAPLALLGVTLDTEKNERLVGKEGRVEASGSIPVMVMKTDEMGEMARIAAEFKP